VDGRALGDRHLRLRDGAIPGDVDRRAAEEVEDPHASLEAGTAHLDELVCAALEPRRHHPAVVVPDAAKALPVARVAPDDPALDDVPDLLAITRQSRAMV
jgi:hypothetical protein